MGGSKGCCFIYGCKTGSIRDRKLRKLRGERNLSLFTPPRDSELFEKWKKAIPYNTKEFSRNIRICELHFTENDIERYFIIKLPGGIVQKIKREKLALKPGSVPCFPNFPPYSSKEAPEIKQLINHNSVRIIKKSKKKKVSCAEHYETSSSVDLQNENITGNCKVAFGSIRAPSPWWGISYTPEFIICTKWSSSYSAEKKVVIVNDLSDVKVFFKDHEVNTEEIQNISSAEDISDFLIEVDKYIICAGIDDKSKTNCMKYMKKTCGRFTPWCKPCRVSRYQEWDRNRRNKESEINKFKKKSCFSCALSKTSRRKQRIQLSLLCPKDSPAVLDNESTDTESNIDTRNRMDVVLAECLIGTKASPKAFPRDHFPTCFEQSTDTGNNTDVGNGKDIVVAEFLIGGDACK